MFSEPLNKVLKPALRAIGIVWLVFSASPLLFAGIIYFFQKNTWYNSHALFELPETLAILFPMLALCQGTASFYLLRKLLNPQRMRKIVAQEWKLLKPEQMQSPALKARLESLTQLDGLEKNIFKTFPKWFSAHLLCWALNEGIAIYGFLLSFFSQRFEPILPYAIAAILLNLSMRPNFPGFVQKIRSSL